MIAIAMLNVFAFTVSCSDPIQGVNQMLSSAQYNMPSSGVYVSNDGLRYKVSTDGPTALSVQSETGDVCLRFWEENKGLGNKEIKRLRGQVCSNKTFGDLDWTALLSSKKPNMIIMYPPNVFSSENIRPIEISLSK